MGAKSTKIVPQFTVTIIVNEEAVVAIDVSEEATLEDARKEIVLESEDFPNLPKDFHFMVKNAPYSFRKENTRTVREIAGSDSRLVLIPTNGLKTDAEEEDKIETTLDRAETVIDTIDEVNNTIVDNTTEEIQKVEKDGTITKEDEIRTASFIELDDTSMALLNDVLDGIEAVSEVIPFAKVFVTTCKAIYDRCQEPERLRAEIQDFLDFIKIIERNVIKGLKNFQEKEPLQLINSALKKGIKTI